VELSAPLVKLATIKRRGGEELRIRWKAFEADDGRRFPYLDVRLWRSGEGGMWPTRKGVTVRRSELGEVGEAIAQALELADEEREP
jgi:hypothetical protein